MATPTNAQQAAQAVAANNQSFLTWAKENSSIVQQGTLPNGGSGGTAADQVTWSNPLPTTPRLITGADFQVNTNVNITVPATSGQATFSPYFPHNMFSLRLNVGGANPIPLTNMYAFYVDEITSTRDFDPAYTGLGRFTSVTSPYGSGVSPYQNDGGALFNLGGAAPSLNIANATGSPVTTTYTMKFVLTASLQRRITLLMGALPNGDPGTKILFTLVVNSLVGTDPLNNPIQDTGVTKGVTATYSSFTVNAVYDSLAVDNLPPGVANPQPTVQMGLQVNSIPVSNTVAGSISYQRHSTAMLFEKVILVTTNGLAAQALDYLSFWKTEDQGSSLFTYDGSLGTYWKVHEKYRNTYHRQLPIGTHVFDLVGGKFPDLPAQSPEMLLATPDASTAAAAGIAATPAMSTAWRLPTGTTIDPTSGSKTTIFEFGWVPVPY